MWWLTGPELTKRAVKCAERGTAGETPREREVCAQIANQSTSSNTLSFCDRPKDVQEFIKLLIRKFGSVTKAWRVLDIHCSGALDFRGFVTSLHKIGCTGNIRSLWFNLDTNQTGHVTLYDLDPEAAEAWDKFRFRCTSTYGSIEHAWHRVLSKEGTPSLSVEDFKNRCCNLGYGASEAEQLFEFLLSSPGSATITLKDLQILQSWENSKKVVKDNQRLRIGWVNKDPNWLPGTADNSPTTRTTPQIFFESPDLTMKDGTQQAKRNCTPSSTSTKNCGSFAMQLGTDHETGPSKFKEFLLRKFESLAAGYYSMDSVGKGMMTMKEFQLSVCQHLVYCRSTDARRLFEAMSKDGRCFTWRDLGVSPQEWIEFLTQRNWQEQLKRNAAEAVYNKAMGGNPRHKQALEVHYQRVRNQVEKPLIAFGQKPPEPWIGTSLPAEIMRPQSRTQHELIEQGDMQTACGPTNARWPSYTGDLTTLPTQSRPVSASPAAAVVNKQVPSSIGHRPSSARRASGRLTTRFADVSQS